MQIILEQIQSSVDLVTQKLSNWLETFIAMSPNFLVAFIVVLVFYLIARLVRKVSLSLLNKFSQQTSINNLISSMLYVAVLIVGTFVALGILNLDKTVTSLLAGAGIIGLAISFAFQDTATNFISGIIMAFRKNFKVGELIETNGYLGKVERINLRSTILRTLDGPMVVIPNKEVLQNPLKNFSKYQNRRVNVLCGVSYNDDLQVVEEVATKALSELPFLRKHKPVQFFYTDFGDSSINFTIRFWISFKNQWNYLHAKSEAMKALKIAFDREEIDIPFPMRTLVVEDNSDLRGILKDCNVTTNN